MTGIIRSIQKRKPSYNHNMRRSEDKKKIYKMGLDKMKSIKESILYKHVLIKNTLKEIQKNNKDIVSFSNLEEQSANKDDLTFDAIEELLKEIDLATKNSLVQKKKLELNKENNLIMEDFHENEAIGQTKIILDDDPASMFDLAK